MGGIQQRYQPDFSNVTILPFLTNPLTTHWDETPRNRDAVGFATIHTPKKFVGRFSSAPDGLDTRLYWTEHEYYEITEGPPPGQVVGNFDTFVPCEQKVSVEISSVLYIHKSANSAQAQKIASAFDRYAFPQDGDPVAFMQQQLAQDPSVNKGMFDIINVFSLTKIGNPIRHDQQKNAILNLYDDKAGGSISPGDGLPPERLNEGGYFDKRNLKYKVLRRENLPGIVTPVKDLLHERDDHKPPEEIILEIVGHEGNVLECGSDFEFQKSQVMTLLEWPEFKIDWRNFEIEIGCNVWVIVTLPVLQTRTSQLNLWVYARWPKNEPIETEVKKCLWFGVLAGTVIGVVTANLPAALIAFKAIFTKCIETTLLRLVACLIPGLAIITEIKPGQDWHDA